MTKTKTSPAPTRRKVSATGNAPKATAKAAKAAPAPKTKSPSKGDVLINMLSRPDGATIAAMMEATGWQQHSLRGFLAGTVKKKLGHSLISQKEDRGRVYRISGEKAAS